MNKLQDELKSDPLGRGYATMTDEQVASDLNTVYRTRIVPIASTELLAWSGGGADDATGTASRYERIEDAATNHASPTVRGVAKAALRLIERDNTLLDLNLPDRQAMLDALVSGGVITTAEKDDLYAIATESVSRAAELGLGRVMVRDVAHVRSVG